MVVTKWKEVFNVIDHIPVRLYVGLMIFISCVMSYMLRTNLSINILAMVQSTSMPTAIVPLPHSGNVSSDYSGDPESMNSTVTIMSTEAITGRPLIVTTPLPDYGERYDWSEYDKSILLGAYFWGYLFSTLIGGFLADKFGAATVILYTMILTCITTALCPLAAHAHFLYIYILRFLTGAFGGPLYPALQNLIAQWAPPTEKGKFMSAMMGGNFGTVITWPLIGLIIEGIGWVYGFYVPALLGAIAACFWWYNVADTPPQHPRIKESEKKMIEDSFQGKVSHSGKKATPPFGKLFQSVPFWALLFLHYGSLWGMYFLLTAAPKFMNEVLGFNLTKSGFLAALPYLARMISAFIFGSIGDYLLQSGRLTVTQIRKTFCIFSHVIPGLLLLAICFIGYRPYWCVAIITLSLGFNGSSTLTNLQNGQDLAPNFAGSIYSLINFAGTTSGFLSPIVVAHFTRESNAIGAWNNVFLVGSVVYIVPAIVFMLFGSGQVQPWNDPEGTETTRSSEGGGGGKDERVENGGGVVGETVEDRKRSTATADKATVTRL